MDKELIVKTICAASDEVFSTMLGLSVTPVSPSADDAPAGGESVLALIGIAGSWIGTGTIKCSPAFACKVGSTMMMAEYEHVNADVLDAMAEIANMIFGNVKTAMEEHVGPLGLSIPTVIFGRNFSTTKAGGQLWTEIPLYVDGGEIRVTFCLTQNHHLTPSVRPGFPRSYSLNAHDRLEKIEVVSQ